MKKNNDLICLSTCGEFSSSTGGCTEKLVIGTYKKGKYNHSSLSDLGMNNIDIIIMVNFKY